MFLQGDKTKTTLERESSSRVLFNDDNSGIQNTAPSDSLMNFAYNHNTEGFQQLVKAKYPQALETASAMAQDVTLNKYYTVETSHETQGDQLQRYYNDSNPIPFGWEHDMNKNAALKTQTYQSFRPKILTDFEDLQLDKSAGKEIDDALLQKIDEVQVFEPKTAQKKEEFATEVDREPATESHIKLNAKGLIACITFMAVTLLIILLVIINSIAIGDSSSKIKRLRDENTQLQQSYNTAYSARSKAFEKGEADAYAYAESQGVVPPIRETLPPISSYPLAPDNPDESTNLFDKIARFFNSIFG